MGASQRLVGHNYLGFARFQLGAYYCCPLGERPELGLGLLAPGRLDSAGRYLQVRLELGLLAR